MSKECCGSKCKDPKNRSNKNCACGGHNASNPKKNIKHHATLNKLNIRKTRKAMDENPLISALSALAAKTNFIPAIQKVSSIVKVTFLPDDVKIEVLPIGDDYDYTIDSVENDPTIWIDAIQNKFGKQTGIYLIELSIAQQPGWEGECDIIETIDSVNKYVK